jgi:four helix bundle protein
LHGRTRHFSELVVWQLADEVRVETLKLTAREGFARDLRLRAQAEDAVNSVCRNIAEGFGCDTHGAFARFLGFSRRSLNELQDALRGARLRRYVTLVDYAPIRMLLRRLYPALRRSIAYLKRTPNHRHRPSQPGPNERSPDRTDKRSRDRTDPRSRDRTDVGTPGSHRHA